MKSGKYSRTAIVVATTRALAVIQDETSILHDPYAIQLITPLWRFVLNRPLLRWFIFHQLYRDLTPIIMGTVLARTRFTEDRIDALFDNDLEQYVQLGAGLDTFAFRRPTSLERLTVIEVDYPATQKLKVATAQKRGFQQHPNHIYLPCDFEETSITEVLTHAREYRRVRTVFGWLGVVPYLKRETIFTFLADLAKISAPNSEIIFDYWTEQVFRPDNPYPAGKRIMQAATRRGEPMLTGFDPEELEELLEAVGWKLEENLLPEQQIQRYFQKSSKCTPTPWSPLARASLIPSSGGQ